MLKAYMCDTVILVRKTGNVSWGERTDAETTVKARIDYKNRMVRDFAGAQVVSSAVVTIENTTLVASDKIKIDGVAHPILSIRKLRAFSKDVALEVSIG